MAQSKNYFVGFVVECGGGRKKLDLEWFGFAVG
jgi:hypothetical protein